jgi:hypothetical protein
LAHRKLCATANPIIKIQDIRILPLKGSTPDGGWSQGFDKDVNLHTRGASRYRRSRDRAWQLFTSATLVEGVLKVLLPLIIGASGRPGERQRNPALAHLWQGHGGAITHPIPGIDIAL